MTKRRILSHNRFFKKKEDLFCIGGTIFGVLSSIVLIKKIGVINITPIF
jgi:hypothetical protein